MQKHWLKKGYPISFPYGENQRYDLVVEINGILKKIQCKHARRSGDRLIFQTSGTNGPYTNDADYFGVYCSEIDRTFLVPVNEVGVSESTFMIDEATARCRSIKEYKI